MFIFFSQFGYCPVVWMSHGREMNNRISHLHERALSIVYDDCKSSFQQLLDEDNFVAIYQRSSFGNIDCLISRNVRSVLNGTENISALSIQRSGTVSPLKSGKVNRLTNLKKKYINGQQKTISVAFAKYTFKALALYNLL